MFLCLSVQCRTFLGSGMGRGGGGGRGWAGGVGVKGRFIFSQSSQLKPSLFDQSVSMTNTTSSLTPMINYRYHLH